MECRSDDLAKLLDQRFPDGSVYLWRGQGRKLYKVAKRRGLIDEYGYLTKAGYRRWSEWFMRSMRGGDMDPDGAGDREEESQAA